MSTRPDGSHREISRRAKEQSKQASKQTDHLTGSAASSPSYFMLFILFEQGWHTCARQPTPKKRKEKGGGMLIRGRFKRNHNNGTTHASHMQSNALFLTLCNERTTPAMSTGSRSAGKISSALYLSASSHCASASG
jgi:hypothetical protein